MTPMRSDGHSVAFALGYAPATRALGKMCLDSILAPIDPNEARRLFAIATASPGAIARPRACDNW